MSKHRPNMSVQREQPGGGARSSRPPAVARMLISLLILWHFAAVFLAALSVPPTSMLVGTIAQDWPMQWYLDALYLNHGHYFFAPNPGPGHIIRWEVRDSQGGVTRGEFPNTRDQWPRLRYHRHFMLTDQASYPHPVEEYRNTWERRYLETYARHLLRVHDGESIRLERIVHWQLPPGLALEGRKLDDPESFEQVMEVTLQRSDLDRTDRVSRWVGSGG